MKNLLIILMIVVIAKESFAEVAPTCGKAWDAPSYLNKGQFQNGEFFEIVPVEGSVGGKVKQTDFNGKVIREFTLPRKPDYILPLDEIKNGIVYQSGGKVFHHDYLNNNDADVSNLSDSGATVYSIEQSSILKYYSMNGSGLVFDTKTQKKIQITDINGAQARGQTVAFPEKSEDGIFLSFSIHNFETGKTQTFDVKKAKDIEITSDRLVKIHPDGSGQLSDSQNYVNIDGQWKHFPSVENRTISAVLDSGEIVYLVAKHKKGKAEKSTFANMRDFNFSTEIYDKDGKTKIKEIPGLYMQGFFGSQSMMKIDQPMTVSTFAVDEFRSIIAGKQVKPRLVSEGLPSPVSDNGEWGLLNSSARNASYLLNLKNGKTFKVPFVDSAVIKPSDDGKNVLIVADNLQHVVDAQSGRFRSFASKGEVKFDKNFNGWFKERNLKEVISEFCFPNTVTVIDDDCNCLIRGADVDSKVASENLAQIQEIALAGLCRDARGFDEQRWNEFTPAISKGEISEKQAVLYLKRFQKRGGYDAKKHLPILTAILKSKIVDKNPGLINEMLKTFSRTQPQLLRAIYNILKIDKKLPKNIPQDESNVCRDHSEKTEVSFALGDLKSLTADQDKKTTTESWLIFKPFTAELQKLPKAELDAIVDGMAETMSVNAATTPEFDGVFQSKLYYFAKKWALDFVGESVKPTTDLAISIRGGETVPIALGSGEVANPSLIQREDELDGKSSFGFEFKTFDPLKMSETAPIGSVSTKSIAWSHDNLPYSAEAKITVLEPLANLISRAPAPDYAALKKDGKLTGMMIVGSNLSFGSSRLVDEYLTYYQNEGFEFKPAKQVDALAMFKKSVQSGELDYLVKEAHSDGDERNLFRANRFGKLLEGTLQRPDGTKEVIYLLAEDENRKESKLISNQDFGSWIRARGKNEPLIYINASCSSARKVISEIAAAHSPNFIPIPSDSSVLTFVNFAGNGTRSILEGFRDGKDFGMIRQDLEQTANFKKGKDIFLFPNEPAYDEQIRKNLKMNLDIEYTVKDSSGKEVHIDENIDHDR